MLKRGRSEVTVLRLLKEAVESGKEQALREAPVRVVGRGMRRSEASEANGCFHGGGQKWGEAPNQSKSSIFSGVSWSFSKASSY